MRSSFGLVSICCGVAITACSPSSVSPSPGQGVHTSPPPTSTFHVVYSFNGADGAHPVASLTAFKGLFYGTAAHGGQHDRGVAFEVNPNSGAARVLHVFGDGDADGQVPVAAVLQNAGELYGTTASGGGGDHAGTIFEIDPSNGAERIVHTFDFSDGAHPYAGLIQVDGLMYGTALDGGANSYGTVFSVSTTGELHVLHSFGGADGAHPRADLLAANGMLYGTTAYGGKGDWGCVFEVNPSNGAERVLHNFDLNGADGARPYAGLTSYKGLLYGTTYGGGAHGRGSVFSVNPNDGDEHVLYSFAYADGSYPDGDLIVAGGELYGTTFGGGAEPHDGTVFQVDPETGAHAVLHSFDFTDGKNPSAGLTLFNGVLYGTTRIGGADGRGAIFGLLP